MSTSYFLKMLTESVSHLPHVFLQKTFFIFLLAAFVLVILPSVLEFLCKGGYWATLWVMGHWTICGYVRAGHGHRTPIRIVIQWTWDLSFCACHRLGRACSGACLATIQLGDMCHLWLLLLNGTPFGLVHKMEWQDIQWDHVFLYILIRVFLRMLTQQIWWRPWGIPLDCSQLGRQPDQAGAQSGKCWHTGLALLHQLLALQMEQRHQCKFELDN